MCSSNILPLSIPSINSFVVVEYALPPVAQPDLQRSILIFLGSFLLSVHNKNVVAALSLSSSTIKLTPVIRLSFFLFNASVWKFKKALAVPFPASTKTG